MNFVQNHNHYTTAMAICIFHGTGERNRGYALLTTAKKPQTALHRAPTFSLLVLYGEIIVHNVTISIDYIDEAFAGYIFTRARVLMFHPQKCHKKLCGVSYIMKF